MDYLNYNKPYLSHWGILGMKWGKRRYQNPDGTLTEEGKKRYGVEERKELTPEEKKARKDEAMKSGDVNKVYEARKDMTNQELRDAITRIDLDKQIRDLKTSEETKKGRQRVDKILKTADTTLAVINKIGKYMDEYDKINKRFNPRFKRNDQANAVKTADINYLNKHFDKMTNDEAADLLNRYQYKKLAGDIVKNPDKKITNITNFNGGKKNK